MHPNTRKSIRWKGFDYAKEGAYYITVCAFESRHFFGQVVNGQMVLNEIGRIVQACWEAIPGHMAHADIDEFIVMPNHMHGIIVIAGAAGARHDAPVPAPAPMPAPGAPAAARPPGIPPGALGQIVASFKSAVSRQVYRDGLLPRNVPVWQRNYWDHVIRDAIDHTRIANYIRDNPAKWDRDRFNRGDRLGAIMIDRIEIMDFSGNDCCQREDHPMNRSSGLRQRVRDVPESPDPAHLAGEYL